jgi:photosystem II stability/assembly factor-like uncharacterized protein
MVKMKLRGFTYLLIGLAFAGFAIYLKEFSEPEIKAGFDKPEGFAEYFNGITIPIGKTTSGYSPNYALNEYLAAKRNNGISLKSSSDLEWVQRGPGNVGGRTRTVIVDPSDATGKTWLAGSVSGGIWKTTDEGQSWTNLTPDLPNLSTASIAIAPSNLNVIYAGTGEGFGGEGMVTGSGIFVSTNKGNSWEIIASTSDDERFRYINKIWVDPISDSILVVATNKGIYKTFDGGDTWIEAYSKGYAVQDIAQNPQNSKVLYAGANSLGVLKSFDGGSHWINTSEGIAECKRVSLTVSPVDTSYVFAGVEGSGYQTQVYLSIDAGKSWRLNRNADGLFINFHQLQGWFNNAIAAHPFERNKVFIGGVYFGQLEFKSTTYVSTPQVVRVDTSGTESFMTFVNFGGSKFGGALATGLDEEAAVDANDFVSVEIRFGPEKKQKAHRFTVPVGEGAGVPPEDYTYRDYVDVPFEVWDVDNNRQLMVSFRDQDNNGKFNLIERKYGDEISGREYFFVHAKTYDPVNPDPDIAVNGGYIQKLLYFLWPVLPEDKTWNEVNIPDATVNIKYGNITVQDAYTTILADDRLNDNLHVDHHDIKFFVTDAANKKFNIIESNDGGLGFSTDEGKTWEQINKGYLTTQFYGVAKRPGRQEYIGGMQDNGTWQSPLDIAANQNSVYEPRIEGDGFEALWHPWYPHRILGSTYNNYFKVSNDYGETWEWTIDGINGDGPFISKLSNSVKNPNLVFAVGSKGVYKHVNFGFGEFSWELVNLEDNWSINKTVTSMHRVEVSKADPSVVWAGAAMYHNPDLNIFVSKDYGQKFDTATNFTDVELGYISGMATHPVNPAEAFILFSYKSKPKILRTYNYGKTWADISGFETDSSSSNGFPDVIVNDLLVFPDDTNTIWAGTQIGIFESNDNGATWHTADIGLPPVSVWQLDIADGEVIVASHGRGIWTANLDGSSYVNETITDLQFELFPNPTADFIHLKFNQNISGDIIVRIYSLDGKLVYSENCFSNSGEFLKTIDVSIFAEGNYLLAVSNSGKQFTHKLVIKR